MRNPENLPHEELVEIVSQIQDRLFHSPRPGAEHCYSCEKVLDLKDTAHFLGELFEEHELAPRSGCERKDEPEVPPVKIVVSVSEGVVRDVYCTVPEAQGVMITWDEDGTGEGKVVEVEPPWPDGGSCSYKCYVESFTCTPWGELEDSDCGRALKTARIPF